MGNKNGFSLKDEIIIIIIKTNIKQIYAKTIMFSILSCLQTLILDSKFHYFPFKAMVYSGFTSGIL